MRGLGFQLGNNRRMIVSCEYNEMVTEMMMMMMEAKALRFH